MRHRSDRITGRLAAQGHTCVVPGPAGRRPRQRGAGAAAARVLAAGTRSTVARCAGHRGARAVGRLPAVTASRIASCSGSARSLPVRGARERVAGGQQRVVDAPAPGCRARGCRWRRSSAWWNARSASWNALLGSRRRGRGRPPAMPPNRVSSCARSAALPPRSAARPAASTSRIRRHSRYSPSTSAASGCPRAAPRSRPGRRCPTGRAARPSRRVRVARGAGRAPPARGCTRARRRGSRRTARRGRPRAGASCRPGASRRRSR